jgi:glycosyltransferase involved in cell wall biosynthesis
MKISHLVTCHNETIELETLLKKLVKHISDNGHQDEIVILDDYSDNKDTIKILSNYGDSMCVNIHQHRLNGNFGEHKTYGSRQCSGDWIVQWDADEYPSDFLLNNLKDILEANSNVDLFRVPRVNIVRGATIDDARHWGWHMSKLSEFGELPIINWNVGDYQSRIYRNDPKIYWHKKLHETITGAEYVCTLPHEVDYAIIHDKSVIRQRSQNEFYNKNWSIQANLGQG